MTTNDLQHKITILEQLRQFILRTTKAGHDVELSLHYSRPGTRDVMLKVDWVWSGWMHEVISPSVPSPISDVAHDTLGDMNAADLSFMADEGIGRGLSPHPGVAPITLTTLEAGIATLKEQAQITS